MRNSAVSEEQQLILAEVARTREKVEALEAKRSEAGAALQHLLADGQQYALLQDICASLERLHELGAEDLFWGELKAANDPTEHLAQIRQGIYGFQQDLDGLEQDRARIDDELLREQDNLQQLYDELARVQEQEERARFEFAIEREYVEPPYRAMVMPWTRNGEDEWRFRKSLLATLFLCVGVAMLVSFWTVTPPPKNQVVEIPERLARLVKKEPPKPVEPREQPKPEQKDEKLPQRETPTAAETQVARKKAESSGLLAFKNSFSDLMDDVGAPKLGGDARISDKGREATGASAERSLIVAQAQGGSGGINTSSLSRGMGNTGRKGGGLQFARVESSIGTEAGDSDRPLSSGPGPSRTDEEIQIVFDRYKAALYRIYNRELRNDPTLRGKMVLRITIEPDGSVSLCKVESTDLQSKALLDEVVARVGRFNFGPKDNVPKVTILYPIDFLPAT
ncbi:MAG: AgmX/PglI C-terminal domain-containing protein [Gammaproteobacteria bacterium]|nr:AgmX/PglI C-terminal domain-containing protein [Gammaproteobacteria bacterium]